MILDSKNANLIDFASFANIFQYKVRYTSIETFNIYPMKDSIIKNIKSPSKCAAGTKKFIIQQLETINVKKNFQ